MNLWVKRVALGLTVAVALFLFSCLDENNVLGFKSKNSRYNVSFFEMEVESSVLPFDSLRSSNYFYDRNSYDPFVQSPSIKADPVNRLLIGSYTDPVFGIVTAEAYSQIRPSSTTRTKETGAVYDSVSLRLVMDYYQYGYDDPTVEQFSVHELQEKLTYARGKDYYTNTSVSYDPTVIGKGTIVVDPIVFRNKIDSAKTTPELKLHIPLKKEFGQRLYDAWNPSSTTFTDIDEFNKLFKGIAVKGVSSKRILGATPSNSSVLTLHYHYPVQGTGKDSVVAYNFYISNVVCSSKISVDRGASELAGPMTPFVEFTPNLQNRRYIQSGGGIFTKLNFSKLAKFSDTVSHAVINSAELSITNINESVGFAPPSVMYLQVLKEGSWPNRLRQLATDSTLRVKDYELMSLYRNSASTLTALSPYTGVISKPEVFTVMSDNQSTFFTLTYDKTTKSYKGYMSLFLQELIQRGELTSEGKEKPIFYKFVLYPGAASKSVNRVSFDKSDVKLKVYYTAPTLNNK